LEFVVLFYFSYFLILNYYFLFINFIILFDYWCLMPDYFRLPGLGFPGYSSRIV